MDVGNYNSMRDSSHDDHKAYAAIQLCTYLLIYLESWLQSIIGTVPGIIYIHVNSDIFVYDII